MEHFTIYILGQMSAETFIGKLREIRLSRDEFDRLSRIFTDAENEMICEHVMYPNSD